MYVLQGIILALLLFNTLIEGAILKLPAFMATVDVLVGADYRGHLLVTFCFAHLHFDFFRYLGFYRWQEDLFRREYLRLRIFLFIIVRVYSFILILTVATT